MVALSALAHAQSATVTWDFDEDRLRDLGIDPSELSGGLSGTADEQLKLAQPGAFLDRFARAAALSTKGMGVDYASNAEKFVVGAAMGAAVSGAPLAFTRGQSDVPESGYAFMTSIHAGLNLGVFGSGDPNFADRIRLYVSGLGFRTPDEYALRGRMANVAGHGQVEIVQPIEIGKLAEWGGIATTAGFEYARYELELSGSLPLTYDTGGISATWIAGGAFSMRSSVFTVPIELSSSFRFVPLTVYGGAGFDIDVARADTTASLSGPVNVAVGGDEEPIGTGSVSFESAGSSEPYQLRGFFGAQVAIYAFKIYGHFNIGAGETYGAFAGLRVAI
jgi:hypothetical protein